ncbi:ketoacyl-ACP synthase III [Phaeobacter gallaeciensis]|uniref:ketoacyl-ACP synthase III n=1 Tax=Phaeobacter gallaeciensis TaxID=60890 RepID=UPI0023806480|nr:ketoacyl-ACP synthase III [Phaeobacter gallaeciensis]MDE4276401.1 ketoacyl-ACP synthase III [Phaeobacter gallaeciensis]MDE4301620.1 ketoacyl-ACP synthase III [Phaeobacter gallaeciensis]MDE5186775.1 ketoacyl-ACP synthase III [Phaeobacter gallaeciensis]
MASNNPFAIREIGTFIPETRIDNGPRAERFDYDPASLRDKIGIAATSRMDAGQETSDLCVAACADLAERLGGSLDPETLDLVVVVTQHPDGFGLPHTSAILHAKLGLPDSCFAFDISLGCSGYVAALATVSGHLMATGGRRALLVTADPYSKSLSEEDKNTAMIFGDAATATLIEPGDSWRIGAFDCGTRGSKAEALQRDADGTLRMNGRAVFDFCAMMVPKSLKRALEANEVSAEDIDAYALHPGSKFIVDTVCKRARIPAPEGLSCAQYGNTVSSSIPLILSGLDRSSARTVLASGFGVGLSWATTVLKTHTP